MEIMALNLRWTLVSTLKIVSSPWKLTSTFKMLNLTSMSTAVMSPWSAVMGVLKTMTSTLKMTTNTLKIVGGMLAMMMSPLKRTAGETAETLKLKVRGSGSGSK